MSDAPTPAGPANAGRPEAELPGTSLIVCSRNRPRMLADSVAAILEGAEVPAELIIVDQSDAADAALAGLEPVRGCAIRYHWLDRPGLSRANNFAIRAATHDCLVFTHDDVLVEPTWFGTLVRALRSAGPRAVVTGRVLPETRAGSPGFVPSTKVDEQPRVYEGRIGEGVLYPMAMAMDRSTFEEVGLFDERLGPGTPFPAAEDNDLCHRLLDAGYRIHYVPDAVLVHRAWRPDGDYLPLRWSYGRGQGAFYAKHMSRRDRFTLRLMTWEMRNRTRRLIRRLPAEPLRAWGEVVYLAGLVSGAAAWAFAYRRAGPGVDVGETRRE